MRLDQHLAEFPEVDCEGFPRATGNLGVPDNGSWTGRSRSEPRGMNNENGEITKERVVVLRRSTAPVSRRNEVVRHPSAYYGQSPPSFLQFPERYPGFNIRHNATSDYLFQRKMQSFPLLKEHRLHRRFRIKEAMRLGELMNQSTKGPESFGQKQQIGHANTSWQDQRTSNGPFSTAGNSWYNTEQKNERKRPTEISVSIWEEFRYGSAIFNTVCDTPVSHGRCEWARPILENFLTKSIVDSVLYIVFFSLYFVSCVIYNDYLELGCYLLYDLHMRMHETADKCKVRVTFNGSVFQGPLYCFVREYCQHCNKVESDKVVLKLMKKMKQDIAYFSNG